jgi:hypothetical protein
MSMPLYGDAGILPAVPKTRSQEAREPIKTSIELPGDLWREAKIRAMDDRVDLRTVMIRALEAYLGVTPRAITRRGRPQA